MTRKRYDLDAARKRAADTSTDSANADAAAHAFPTRDATDLRVRLQQITKQEGAFLRVSLDSIDPAPWQPRVDFSGVESLVRTIGGADGEAGVGVLEPVLLQRAGDRYRLIDGECRWRAAKVVAQSDATAAREIPALVFDIDDASSQLMGLVVNEDRNAFKPFELAVAYSRAKAALETQEHGGGALRRMEAIFAGRHRRSSLSIYTSTGQWLTPELMACAAKLSGARAIDPQELSRLRRQDLRAIAQAAQQSNERGAAVLRELLGAKTVRAPTRPPVSGDLATRIAECNEEGIASIRSKALDVMAREQARRLLDDQLLAAFIATAERACGSSSAPGIFAATAAERHVVVMPARIESLSIEQIRQSLPALEVTLKALRRAVTRAKRDRRVAAMRGEPEASAA